MEDAKIYQRETEERTAKEQKLLIHRLNRIEGQIRGMKGMIERDAYYADIVLQVTAANAALNSFSKEIIVAHMKGSMMQDIREGYTDNVDELVTVIQKLMK